MCMICDQLHEELISDYDAEILYIEHSHSIGINHALICIRELRRPFNTVLEDDADV